MVDKFAGEEEERAKARDEVQKQPSSTQGVPSSGQISSVQNMVNASTRGEAGKKKPLVEELT
jgi:hypothetical protein